MLPRQSLMKRPQGNGKDRPKNKKRQKRNTPEDPLKGWRKRNSTQHICIQNDLSQEMLSARARLLCALAMTKLTNEIQASGVDDRSVGVMSLFTDDMILQLLK